MTGSLHSKRTWIAQLVPAGSHPENKPPSPLEMARNTRGCAETTSLGEKQGGAMFLSSPFSTLG
jgi:hypothetical protein